MKKLIFLILPIFVFAQTQHITELRNCYDNGDQSCGFLLAKELRKDIKTEEEGLELLLQLTLSGHESAPTQLALAYIYPKITKKDCKKGITFLFLASKTDPEALKELALLFKRGTCIKKDLKKYQKYLKIYVSEKEKIKKD